MISKEDRQVAIIGAGAIVALILFAPAVGKLLDDLKEAIIKPPADAPTVDPDDTIGGWLWDAGHDEQGKPNFFGHVTDFWLM